MQEIYFKNTLSLQIVSKTKIFFQRKSNEIAQLRLPRALSSRCFSETVERRNQARSNKEPRKSKGPRIFPTFHSPSPNKSISKVWSQRFPSLPSFDCSALFFFFLIYGKREKCLISLHLPKKERHSLALSAHKEK